MGIIFTLLGFVIGLTLQMSGGYSLQQMQRDTSRKNDVSVLSAEAVMLTSSNRKIPAASDLSTAELEVITTVTDRGEPTTETAVYAVGMTCDGAGLSRQYAISVRLENGTVYCLDS